MRLYEAFYKEITQILKLIKYEFQLMQSNSTNLESKHYSPSHEWYYNSYCKTDEVVF